MSEQETKARQVVADLRDQLAAAQLRKTELEDQRDALAFDALTGDASAKLSLAKITKELISHDQQLLTVQAAIREGEQRVLHAQGIVKAEIDRRNADEARRLGTDLLNAAKAADSSLGSAFIAMGEMRDTVQALNRLGCGPNLALADVNLKRALISASMGSGYALGHLPPGERHTISELGATWAATAQHWATRTTATEAEAA